MLFILLFLLPFFLSVTCATFELNQSFKIGRKWEKQLNKSMTSPKQILTQVRLFMGPG